MLPQSQQRKPLEKSPAQKRRDEVHEEQSFHVVSAEQEQLEESRLLYNLDNKSPLFGYILPCVKRGDYVVLLDRRNNTYKRRAFHHQCVGLIEDKSVREERMKYASEHRIVIVDISQYPELGEDGEWEYYVKKMDPEIRDCSCNFVDFALKMPGLKRYHITLPQNYYYLCGMNRGDETKVAPKYLAFPSCRLLARVV